MSRARAILVCEDVRGEHWQLRGPSDAARLMIGWTLEGEDQHDAGVPRAVAEVLAGAFVSSNHVAFFSSREQSGAHTIRLGASFVSRLFGSPSRRGSVICTRDVAAVTDSFDDDAFPWSMLGQLLLLGDERLAQLNARFAEEVLKAPTSYRFEALEAAGVELLATPGVDGDVAGLFASTRATCEQALSALRTKAEESDFAYESLDENAFTDAVAGARSGLRS